ncbi:MAG: translation initiation factor IF-2 N-terminal domain-containing protein, partial [Bacteroidota bacterium]
MAELKLPRLLGAAKEFNIGQDTLIEFLIGKGFPKDDLKPTSKLSEEMYRALQLEFQGDKAAKMKSDQVDLPKGAVAEAKKKKEDEEISFRKEEKHPPKIIKKEEEKPVEEIQVTEPVKEEPKKEEEIIKPVIPEIEKPKVIDKIDLSTIDSSTRPKKIIKKTKTEEVKEEPIEENKKPGRIEKVKKGKKEEPVVEEIAANAEELQTTEEELPPVIENIKADKIEGPKILGKISLPVDNDTRPKKEEKRKRKRIPIEKKEVKRDGVINKEGDRKPGAGGGTFNRGGDNRGRSGAGNRRDNRGVGRREEKLIDEKEIQEKIRETQAKLAGAGGRGKSLKAKIRREKRQEAADAQGDAADDNKLAVTEFISVSELANLMDVSFAEVISKCMSLGIMVSINQ